MTKSTKRRRVVFFAPGFLVVLLVVGAFMFFRNKGMKPFDPHEPYAPPKEYRAPIPG